MPPVIEGASTWLLLGVMIIAVPWVVLALAPSKRNQPGRWLKAVAWCVTLVTTVTPVLVRLGRPVDTTNLALAFGALSGLVLLAGWRRRGRPHRGLAAAGMLYLATQLLALALNGQTGYLVQAAGLLTLPAILVALRATAMSREAMLGLAHRLAAYVVYGSVLVGLLWPAAAYTPSADASRRADLLGLQYRLAGLTPHQNLLAVTAVALAVLAFGTRHRLRWFSLAVVMVALVMTESRNAALTLLLVALVGWLLRGGSAAARLLVIAPGLVVTTYLLLGSVEQSEGIGQNAENLNGRFDIWRLAAELWPQRPLFGWGPMAFQPDAGTPFSLSGYLNAHNQWVEALVEAGLAGALAMATLTVVVAKIGWQNRQHPVYPCLAVALLVGLVTEVFLTLHLYGLSYVLVPAFIFMAGLMSADRAASDAVEMKPVTRSRRRAVALA